MATGFKGKILRIDLSKGSIAEETPTELFYRTYMGGSCFALYNLLKELKPGTDPLGPDNVLVFATGALTGVPVAGMTRFTIAARSPLTGGLGESEAGGFWGPELKFAGFDGLIVKGRSEKPVYLWVHDGNAAIRDATHLWGMDTGEAQERMRTELGDKRIRILLIGPGGENLVRYACVVNNLKHVCGRTGMGAVMGSKNLKAIAVRGKEKISLADGEGFRKITQAVTAAMETNIGTQNWRKLGTAAIVNPLNAGGMLPTLNFKRSRFEGAQKIAGETMEETISVGNEGCYACGIRCKRKVRVEGIYQVSEKYGGPEYETLGALGSCLGIDNLEAIAKGNELCNRYTLDTISTGMSIAFAMECFQEGLLTLEDTEGLELKFGNTEAMLTMIEHITYRKGLGNLLADGVRRAAAKIGDAALPYALHVKGQELPLHEPRGKFGQGFGFAVSPTGADHLEAPPDQLFQAEAAIGLKALAPLGILEPLDPLGTGPHKVRLFRHAQLIFNLWNCLGVCNFAALPFPAGVITLPQMVEIVRCVTGWDTSLYELLKVGERMAAMGRMFNLREGIGADEDTLPKRLFEPLPDGPNQGKGFSHEDFETAKSNYYGMMGWGPEDGHPTPGKLHELNLGWLVA